VSYETWPRNTCLRSYFTDSKHKACYVSRTSTVKTREVVLMSAELTAGCLTAVGTSQWRFQFLNINEICDSLTELPS
jgi:hypothetical protein